MLAFFLVRMEWVCSRMGILSSGQDSGIPYDRNHFRACICTLNFVVLYGCAGLGENRFLSDIVMDKELG